MVLRMKKMKMLIFYTPPMQNHYFWGPMEAEKACQSDLETIFWAIDIDALITMHVQEARDAAGGGWRVSDALKLRGARLDKTLRIEFRSIGVFNSGGWISGCPYT